MAIALIVLIHVWFTIVLIGQVVPQVIWTPIYIDSNSQVDLWTKASRGCMCPWDEAGQKDCACCVQDGGCHCGQEAPNRCAQCGLEHFCSSMCNLTIDSNTLLAKSGKTFGQIKSPSIEGPSSCWYTFRPALDQRVELQIYRIVDVGRFNGTSCDGGFLEWQPNDSDPNINPPPPLQICGANERYSPPVVMYSDTNNTANLFFQMNEKTLRSQFLAYFSFTPKKSLQGVGFQAKGGTRIPNTSCDWSYKESSCANGCTLASPGYPGIYSPNRQCKYHITTSSIYTRVKIIFTTVLLPHNHCLTDYIAVYQGSTVSDLLLTTICGNRPQVIEYNGPNILIEFSSGPQVPPYNYNGFVANLEFIDATLTTESAITTNLHNKIDYSNIDETENTVLGTYPTAVLVPKTTCDVFISGNNSRSGHFDTRSKEYNPFCRIVFRGSPTDVIHLSMFNYRLKAPACRSVIEIYDGNVEDGIKPFKKLCSPITKMARDSHGKFIEQQTFISKGNTFTLILRRNAPSTNLEDVDYVDGAYLFHDEQIGGTLQPDKMCDVHYYGMSSPSVGTIDNPVDQHLFWNVNGQLKCVQQFIPAANQSITITIRTLGQMKGFDGTHCQTQCGDNGCQCVADTTPLDQIDHLLLMSDDNIPLTCLCGNFQAEWLPVIVRSWSPLHVIYSVAQYTWSNKGYSFSAVYSFITDGECGHHTYTHLVGEIDSKNLTSNGHFNNFYHLNCVWILDSTVQRQLIIEATSIQNRPCTAWNISIHEYSPDSDGELLHTFCSRDKHKIYSLPWKTATAVIRLKALTRKQPQFLLKWRSQMVRSNTRLVNPTPAPNAVLSATHTQRHMSSSAIIMITLSICLIRL
ncbi:uncharacterized protein LOC123302190 [Chrysoperla carnea]|uniref:uncharacterized protein LOC123302190 n=1 Tax=Chrysoperla carnea TaxID=189513 RepID=UPI001D07C055|nr:uncharacterized protein LOC123302190 [Chrysoperla carnea]